MKLRNRKLGDETRLLRMLSCACSDTIVAMNSEINREMRNDVFNVAFIFFIGITLIREYISFLFHDFNQVQYVHSTWLSFVLRRFLDNETVGAGEFCFIRILIANNGVASNARLNREERSRADREVNSLRSTHETFAGEFLRDTGKISST